MIFRFNDFEINTETFTLSNNGQPISAEPQVFDLIVYLISHRDKVTTRQQLFDDLWGGRLVSDATLTNHIKMARAVLQDNVQEQAIIKTVRSRGYQFIAKIIEESSSSIIENDNQSKVSRTTPDNIAIKKSWISAPLILLYFIISLVVIILFLANRNVPSITDSKDIPNYLPSVLVVPFTLSGKNKKEWEPFADQMTREVIRNLKKISGLRVIPASSAFTFKNNQTRSYIRQRLPNVRYVLEAFVSIGNGGQFRITTELDELQSGKLVWDHEYQSQINNTNFFSVQTDIATSVSGSLKIAIDDDEKQMLRKMPTKNLAAYELYIEGKYQFNLLTHDSLYKSIKLFSNAIALDPSFKDPYIAKADSYRMLMSNFEIPKETLPFVIEAVVDALKISPDSAEARSSLGLAYTFAWRWRDSWNMLNEARSLNPELALTELGFALYYSGIGDVEGVHRSLNQAVKLDPLNVEIADWGHWALAMLGETKDAVEWASKQIKLHPKVGIIYSGASVSASMNGDHQRAITLANKGVKLDPESTFALLILAQAYGYADDLDNAQSVLDRAETFSSYVCPYESAIVYLQLGNKVKAYELLHQAVDMRSNCLVFVRNDPRLIAIKDDTDFSLILTLVGLDDASYQKYSR